jgi:predicted CoA-substrate-specific enzyme activase
MDENEVIYSTGYFRKLVPHAKAVTEITAAIHGIKYDFPDAEVIVDIGGQDTKVIDIRTNEFVLNDKCSAGTGAFLELAANYFEISLEDLGKLHFKAKTRADINDTCGVFAVSEMISQLAKGYTMEEVISGMHYAFSQRIVHMVPEAEKIVLIGGTAKNRGIVSALSELCERDLLIPNEPQIINAIGAVMFFKSEQD